MMQHGNESKDILTSRVKKICIDNNINMYKCLLDSNYYSFVKKQMKGLEAKGPFSCLGLQVRIKRAYQVPINFSLLWLVKYF